MLCVITALSMEIAHLLWILVCAFDVNIVSRWMFSDVINLCRNKITNNYNDVIMGAIASQITSLTIVYSIVYSGADQRKHQSSASLAFVRGIHREPVNSPHKWPVTRKMFPFDDVIMLRWRRSVFSCHKFNLNIANSGAELVKLWTLCNSPYQDTSWTLHLLSFITVTPVTVTIMASQITGTGLFVTIC